MPKGIINQSYELRKLIIHQAERFNIPLIHICKRVGIDIDRFISGYCNKRNLSTTYPLVTDSELLEIASLLGVDVRIQLVVKKVSNEEMLTLKNELKDAYGYKKKGAATTSK